MRIGLDIRYLTHGLVGGVQTYVRHLAPALLQLASPHEFILYGDTKIPPDISLAYPNTTTRLLPYRNGASSIYHDLVSLRNGMAQDGLQVAHFPGNYGFAPKWVKTVITLHDQINIMPWREIYRGHPKNLRTVVMMAYLHLCSRASLKQVDLILTVSEYAKQQIQQYAGLDPSKIIAIHSGIDPDFQRVTDAKIIANLRSRYPLARPFILADALKNPAVIVRAWERLPEALQQTHQIIFFSRRPDPLPIVQQAVEAGYGALLIKPSREDLAGLFSLAQAFVFPSWIEGFGLPLLEAMTCGAPVIASDRGSIPEVAGNAALIVDAEDDEALAGHLANLLTSPTLAREMQERGYARAGQFSWTNTARKVLDCYESLA